MRLGAIARASSLLRRTTTHAALALARLVDDIRFNGHRIAKLDPLKRTPRGPWVAPPVLSDALTARPLAELVSRLDSLPLQQQEQLLANTLYPGQPTTSLAPLLDALAEPLRLTGPTVNASAPLAQRIRALLDCHCGTLAVESGHLSCTAQREWVQDAVESHRYAPTPSQQRHVLRSLVHADTLERFLEHRFPSSKRFGIEGCEATIPGLLALCAAFAEHGGRRVELAMAHRYMDV